jgi:transcriptional regulator of arginine metabolism
MEIMMENERTNERQQALKMIVGARKISDQQTLLELLDKEYNIQTSQAVVSRDLRSLGIVKKAINGHLMYDNIDDPSKDLLRKAVLEVRRNESLIVVSTLPGCAAFVGDYIDAHKQLGILGTLAGENIVFVTPVSTADIEKVFVALKNLMYTLA